jgi:hypothetical protein
MATRSRVRGGRGFRKILKQLPDAAREGMADILDLYGSQLLTAMRQDVPVDTGYLKGRLSKRLARKSLLLRVGFIGKGDNGPVRSVTRKTNRGRRRNNDQFVGKQFYGRFVEFGRKAKTVRVTRRAKVLRITGNNRNGNKREFTYGSGVYSMNVPRMAGRPFIFKKRPGLRSKLSEDLRGYWTNVLTAAAAGAGFDD